MDKLLDILKTAAPALATAVTGPLGGVVLAAIAEKLGVDNKLDVVTQTLTADPQAALKLREIDVRQFEIEQKAVSERWQADMGSDSWLSKNIRPMSLIAIFVAYFIFTAMSAFGYNAQESYVQLLGQWGQIIFLAYFGGRTVEKLADMKTRK